MNFEKRQIKVSEVDPGIEKLIVTGMIIDTKFLSNIYHIAKPEYFKGTFTRMIAEWCREYFVDQKKSPGKVIQDIYEVKVGTESGRDENEIDMLATAKIFLQNISKEFSGGKFNSEYILSKAIPYLQHNSLEIQLKKAQRFADGGDDENALKILRDAGKEIFTETNKIIDFPDIEDLREMYHSDRESLFSFSGELGRYMNPLRRSKLMVFLGPTKRGKTHWLLECAINAVFSGLKVAFFSLELTKEEVQELIVMRFTNKEFGEGKFEKKTYLIPVFDCVLNQTGECVNNHCTSQDSCLIDPETSSIMEWSEEIDHKACTECLRFPDLASNYEMATWFETIKRPTIKEKDLHKFCDDFIRQKGSGSLKIKAYPISTATIGDVENDLDKEEAHNQWIPDVLIIDSLDNFKKNGKLGEKRFQLSEIWEEASKITKVRNMLTFSATQGNRGSFLKERLEATDIAEDWSKAMVVDALFALNEQGVSQTDKVLKDVYWKRQRIECLLHRGKKILPGQQCLVLQNFDLGQVCLDSKIIYYNSMKGRK